QNIREEKLHENLFWASIACWLEELTSLAEPNDLEENLQTMFNGFLESDVANDLDARTSGMVLKDTISELFHMLQLFPSVGVARQIKSIKVHPKEYRNSNPVTSNEGTPVDENSLWRIKDTYLVLVDDDQYVTHKLTTDFREEA